ncbi:MAG: diadenylate cyclase CdaA [Candidatus Electrothrix sp. GW3-4]|uniref:diadenylate cyclase CdaA n=1 Tax=Candidatus Electrothrix sp. GW3-4 TaxID=3126740 RepID=UPI0030CD7889
MPDFLHTFNFPRSVRWQDLIDILIVSFVIYRTILLIRGTRAVQMLIGILVVSFIYFVSIQMDLLTLQLLLRYLLSSILLILVVIFQDDIRRVLTEMGRTPFLKSQKMAAHDLTEIISAAVYMARRRIGALIIIERDTGLAEYIETGFILDAKLLQELLVALFFPMSPMHDGAVVIKKGRIHSAACLLPLSKNPDIDKRYGTRHRAALGLSEETDAVVIVVSEETQEISVVQGGDITPMRDEVKLEALLKEILLVNSRSESLWTKNRSSQQRKSLDKTGSSLDD